MALFFSRAEEIETVEEDGAKVVLYRLGASTLVTSVSGHPRASHVVRLQRRSDDLIARAGSIDVVHDWFGVTGYDAEVRQKMTPWAFRTRAAHRSIHIGTCAGLVRMGFTMVRIATGAPIRAHESLVSLEAALAEILAQRAS